MCVSRALRQLTYALEVTVNNVSLVQVDESERCLVQLKDPTTVSEVDYSL